MPPLRLFLFSLLSARISSQQPSRHSANPRPRRGRVLSARNVTYRPAALRTSFSKQLPLPTAPGQGARIAYLDGFSAGNVHIPGCSLFVHEPSNDKYISAGIVSNGRWTQPDDELFRRQAIIFMARVLRSQPGSWFIDIGANIGTFSLPLLVSGYRGILFEGLPRNAGLLRGSIAINGIDSQHGGVLHAPCVLVSSTNATSPPYACMASSSRSTANNQGGAFVSVRATRALANAMSTGLNASNQTVADAMCKQAHATSVAVRTATLADILPPPRNSKVPGRKDGQLHIGVIKMDIEGSEFEVLQGARSFLKAYLPAHILIEERMDNRKRLRSPQSPVTLLQEEFGYVVVEANINGGDNYHLAQPGTPPINVVDPTWNVQ